MLSQVKRSGTQNRKEVFFMSTGEHMTHFLKKDSYIPSYAAFPRYLFRMEISETAKLIYVLLLDRARLSMKNEGWVNEFGHVFIYYTIEDLAKDCGKSQMTVKNSLTALERAGLIYRQRQGYGLPNRLFVKIRTENETSRQTEFETSGQTTFGTGTDRKLSPSNKNRKKNTQQYQMNYGFKEGESL
jgi:DNA-binding transcriptional ArsR family regulator